MQHIHSYSSPNDLYNQIIGGLNKIGKNLSAAKLDDLQPAGEFHIHGDVATIELITLSSFISYMYILRTATVAVFYLSTIFCWNEINFTFQDS